MSEDRGVFMTLTHQWYEAFESGEKRWDMRELKPRRWDERTLYAGRKIRLARGYTSTQLHGIITDVRQYSCIGSIPEDIWAETIPPRYWSNPWTWDWVVRFVGGMEKFFSEPIILIKVDLEEETNI